MRFLFFGLSITSGWANGHAGLYRGLTRALAEMGHSIDFVERDDPGRAAARDLVEPGFARVQVYSDWEAFRPEAASLLALAGVVVVGSRLEDGQAIADYVLGKAPGKTVYYDLDVSSTLDAFESTGGAVGGVAPYIRADQIRRFDLVCAATLGSPLAALMERYHAKRAISLLGAMDDGPDRPVASVRREFRSTLTFFGSYGLDRAATLERLVFGPARRVPAHVRVVVAGLGFADGPLPAGVTYYPHIMPAERAELFSGAALAVNVTRPAVLGPGCCPSTRLFEAAGAATCVVTDPFLGLESLFRVGEEVLVARDTEDVLSIIDMAAEDRAAVGLRARWRALREHTYGHRARELCRYLACG